MSPGATDPKLMDPGFKIDDHDKVRTGGSNMGKRAPVLGDLGAKTQTIDMHTLTFGAIGGGLNVAHREVRDKAVAALAKAKEVLESFGEAVGDVVANVEAAHAASSGKPPEDGPGGLGGGVKSPKLDGLGKGGPTPKFDTPGLGDLGDKGLGTLPGGDSTLPGPDTGDLPNPPGIGDLPKPPGSGDLPNPPGTGGYPNPPGAGDIPKAPVFDPGQQGVDPPKLGGLDPNSLKVPSEDALKTQLAGYDPKSSVSDALNARLPGTSDLKLPGAEGLNTNQRGLTTGNGMGAGSGFAGGGSGVGGLPGQGLGGALGRGAGGAAGMPMMPMAPGAGMGGEGDKDRERTTWLSEDEDAWGGDGDVAPPVLM